MASEPEQRAGSPSFSNLGYVEELYFDFLRDPDSVEPTWRRYFQDLAEAGRPPAYEVVRRPEGPLARRRDADGRTNGQAASVGRAGRGPGGVPVQDRPAGAGLPRARAPARPARPPRPRAARHAARARARHLRPLGGRPRPAGEGRRHRERSPHAARAGVRTSRRPTAGRWASSWRTCTTWTSAPGWKTGWSGPATTSS